MPARWARTTRSISCRGPVREVVRCGTMVSLAACGWAGGDRCRREDQFTLLRSTLFASRFDRSFDVPAASARRDGRAPRGVEPLHDLRLVRAPAQLPGEPVVRGGDPELGDRVLRVPAPGP